MRRIRYAYLKVGLLVGIMLGSRSSEAQYTASYQTNTISGVASNWAGDYLVGDGYVFDALQIIGGGVLADNSGFLGYTSGSTNNGVLVSGTGSVWSNSDLVVVGWLGSGNSLVISGGGKVFNSYGWIGFSYGSDSNRVLVTGSGSVWSNWSDLYVGEGGHGNSLVIDNYGKVSTAYGWIGAGSGSDSNSALVTGTGSVWSNGYQLTVGRSCSGNSLVVSNGGKVLTYYGYVGRDYGSSNNSAVVTGTGSVWSNSSGLSIGDESSGGNSLVISNGGTVVSSYGHIGFEYESYDSDNNSVLVTDTGSVWNSGSWLTVGDSGSGNSLVISNGGKVLNGYGGIGFNNGSDTNSVLVTGSGSAWSNSSSLYVGYYGSKNSLAISKGGTVVSPNLFVGYNPSSTNNLVMLDAGNLIVANATIGNGAIVQFALGTNSHPVVVSSNLTLGGTLNITDGGGFTNGTYTLFSYGGTLTYNGVTIATAPSGYLYEINTNTAGQVNLTMTHLVVNPASLNFGSVTIGQSSSLNFYAINTGDLSLSGTATSMAPFAVTSPPDGGFNVAGGQTGTVTVTFTPAAAGAIIGSVVFTSNCGDSTNGVTGVGVCGYALSGSSAGFPAKGGTNTVNVITSSPCLWTATPSNVWLTILSGTNGVGSGTVTYVVDPNASSNARTGMLSIARQTFTARQKGNTAPQVTITPVSPITLPKLTVNLSATATDSDGAPSGTVSTAWSKVSGGGSVVFSNVNAISTTATFPTNGTYVLRLTASDGALSTSNDVTVIVNAPPRISTPPAATNELAQVDGLTVVAGGEPVCFTVGAYDPDTNSLSCLWDFGDGVPITDCNPCHVFTNNCGQYTVSVVVSDGLASTNATSLVTIACQMAVTKMQVKWNFAPTNSDSCTLSGVLDLGARFNPASKVVTLDIGGAQVWFTLDAKGKGNGVSHFGSCNLAYNKKTRQWTLSANLAKGTWRTLWAAHGLVNKTIPKPGVWVIMPVVVVIGDDAFADERSILYTAKSNKSGSAK